MNGKITYVAKGKPKVLFQVKENIFSKVVFISLNF